MSSKRTNDIGESFPVALQWWLGFVYVADLKERWVTDVNTLKRMRFSKTYL